LGDDMFTVVTLMELMLVSYATQTDRWTNSYTGSM